MEGDRILVDLNDNDELKFTNVPGGEPAVAAPV